MTRRKGRPAAHTICATDALRRAYRDRPRTLDVKQILDYVGLPSPSAVTAYFYGWLPATKLNTERMRLLAELLGAKGKPYQRVEAEHIEQAERLAADPDLGRKYETPALLARNARRNVAKLEALQQRLGGSL